MAKKDLKYYYTKARREGWALAQFNWSSAEMLKGIVQAAVSQKSPLLVGTSEGDSEFVGLRQAVVLVGAYRKDTGIPIFLNLDHGKSFEKAKEAIELGYDAVHFDGSDLPLKENIEVTKKVVSYAHKKGISIVEGEVGKIEGRSVVHTESVALDSKNFTTPEDAEYFAKMTNVDSLAVFFGNVHGVYKDTPPLDLERLQNIQKRVESFLVMHGGSGIPDQEVLAALRLGVVKINISTDLRAVFAKTIREVLNRDPDEVTPYKFFPPAVQEVQKVAEARIQFLGSAGKI